MFEIVNPTVRYAKASTCIGVVAHGPDALLVDTGLDENLVRKVINALAHEGATVRAIVNTHAHADHIGGNSFAQKRTGARVVAPAFEHAFIERPQLEPYTLYGALPPHALEGKFLQAAPSQVHEVVDGPGERDVAGFRVRFHALPGHSVHQMGVEVDGALFVGDALLPEATLSKYGLAFAVDPLAARASTQRLLDHDAQVVSYHGGLVTDLAGAVRANVAAGQAAEDALVQEMRKGPATAEDLLVAMLDRFPPANLAVELHALQAATVRGYLSALERGGRAVAAVEKGRLVWALR